MFVALSPYYMIKAANSPFVGLDVKYILLFVNNNVVCM